LRTLAAQGLGFRRILPYFRVFQFADYFFETIFIARIVKDTP
jgi:hypothetical protein